MFDQQFHLSLKFHREDRGLSQKEAAELCNISPWRWSALECGRRMPNSQELGHIRRWFKLGRVFISPPKATKQLLDNGARLTECPQPFFAHRDRPSYNRYRTCLKRQGELTGLLTRRINQRSDVESALCQQFCHLVTCESYLEALYVLYLLADGAVPALVAPSLFHPTPVPVVDPRTRNYAGNRPRPCLVLGTRYQFFQVSFQGSLFRVDVLEWSDQGWRIIEIDGTGHSSNDDREREIALGLPTSRLREVDILSLAWGICRKAA